MGFAVTGPLGFVLTIWVFFIFFILGYFFFFLGFPYVIMNWMDVNLECVWDSSIIYFLKFILFENILK